MSQSQPSEPTTEPTAKPVGELVIRTLAMPADANPAGDIFGGWVLSQMDIAGGILAGQRARGRVATVAVTAMTFHLPVYVLLYLVKRHVTRALNHYLYVILPGYFGQLA